MYKYNRSSNGIIYKYKSIHNKNLPNTNSVCVTSINAPCAALSQTIRLQPQISGSSYHTSHSDYPTTHNITTIFPSILQDGVEPGCVGLDWLGRTFPDLVCLEGQGMTGLAGPTLHGRVCQAWRQYEVMEQGTIKITISPKGQITLTSV